MEPSSWHDVALGVVRVEPSLDGVCAVCDQEVTVHDFEAGHVVSDNHGGAPELHNLRVICPPCNKSCG